MDPDTTIGRYSSIAYTAAAFGANHPMNAKSTHAIFYNPALGETDVDLVERTKLTIGSDVWMGHNSIVLNGVESIGHGAVIGAGSVVHKDVPPYAVVVGHPARVVRYRFSDEIIEELLAEQWWERSFEDLKAEGLEKFQQPLEGDFLR
jgi:acetyltransferase-like isoleucine patch superfamily enzyme